MLDDKKPIINSDMELLSIPKKDSSKTTIKDDDLRVVVIMPDNTLVSVKLSEVLGEGGGIPNLNSVLSSGDTATGRSIQLYSNDDSGNTVINPNVTTLFKRTGIDINDFYQLILNNVTGEFIMHKPGHGAISILKYPENSGTLLDMPLSSGRLALESQIPDVLQLRQIEYSGDSGQLVLTTPEEFTQVVGVFVNGQRLSSTQYNTLSTTEVQITDVIETTDLIVLQYLTGINLVVVPYYTQAQTDFFLDVINTRLLGLNKVIYNRSFPFSSTTGTILETLVTSIPLPRVIPTNSILKFNISFFRSFIGLPGTTTLRLYFNTSNSLSGASLLGQISTTGTSNVRVNSERKYQYDGNVLNGLNSNETTPFNEGGFNISGGVSYPSSGGDNIYWLITLQNSTTSLSASLDYVQVETSNNQF